MRFLSVFSPSAFVAPRQTTKILKNIGVLIHFQPLSGSQNFDDKWVIDKPMLATKMNSEDCDGVGEGHSAWRGEKNYSDYFKRRETCWLLLHIT